MTTEALPTPSDDDQHERDLKLLKRLCLQVLGCNWDTVQVIVTRHDSEGLTKRCEHGEGNWYARYGSVKEWLLKEEELERDKYRSRGE